MALVWPQTCGPPSGGFRRPTRPSSRLCSASPTPMTIGGGPVNRWAKDFFGFVRGNVPPTRAAPHPDRPALNHPAAAARLFLALDAVGFGGDQPLAVDPVEHQTERARVGF